MHHISIETKNCVKCALPTPATTFGGHVTVSITGIERITAGLCNDHSEGPCKGPNGFHGEWKPFMGIALFDDLTYEH